MKIGVCYLITFLSNFSNYDLSNIIHVRQMWGYKLYNAKRLEDSG